MFSCRCEWWVWLPGPRPPPRPRPWPRGGTRRCPRCWGRGASPPSWGRPTSTSGPGPGPWSTSPVWWPPSSGLNTCSGITMARSPGDCNTGAANVNPVTSSWITITWPRDLCSLSETATRRDNCVVFPTFIKCCQTVSLPSLILSRHNLQAITIQCPLSNVFIPQVISYYSARGGVSIVREEGGGENESRQMIYSH